jgi:hypothetical protein
MLTLTCAGVEGDLSHTAKLAECIYPGQIAMTVVVVEDKGHVVPFIEQVYLMYVYRRAMCHVYVDTVTSAFAPEVICISSLASRLQPSSHLTKAYFTI